MLFRDAAFAILLLCIPTANTVTAPAAKLWAITAREPSVNLTALELFERSRRSYERTYPHYGRIPGEIDFDAVTLDFEIETCARVRLTPELLLQRGGIDADLAKVSSTSSALVQDSEESHSPMWPKVSEWFSLGIDGTGHFVDQNVKDLASTDKLQNLAKRVGKRRRSYRQDLSGQIELESVLMRPKQVIDSNFAKDLESFMERLWTVKQSHVGYWSKRVDEKKKGIWYRLPFNGSRGLHIFGAVDPSKPCDVCHVQWTAGLPLQHVLRLLQLSTSAPLQGVLQRTNVVCARHTNGCSAEYQALISLAAWTLNTARRCTGCAHPKRCMSPWLVRTHFGDLAMHVKEKRGTKALEHLLADVLEIAQVSGNDPVLPDGAIDYLRLPEMAELGGVVHARNPSLQKGLDETSMDDMPSDVAGLLKLSARMLKSSKAINERLRQRACKLHSRNNGQGTFTVMEWLQGLLHGKDLMSDHDSPMSQSSFSHLIWKSMGSWRMKPGSDRVYLECRSTKECIRTEMQVGAPSLIQFVGRSMYDFERAVKKATARAARERIASLHRWSRGAARGAGTSLGASRPRGAQSPRRQRLNFEASATALRAARRSAPRRAAEAGRRVAEVRARGQVRGAGPPRRQRPQARGRQRKAR